MMTDYIKLIRVPNLIFIAGIQLLMHFCIVTPIVNAYGIELGIELEPSMSLAQLILLIVATVFIAAGGYIINDYFDIRIDEINKPDTQIVGKSISRKQAMFFYQAMSAIGVAAGLLLSYSAGSLTYAFIFLMTLGLLWFYSSSYKRQLVVGNSIVAILAAMTLFIVALFENRFLLLEYGPSEELVLISNSIMGWIGGFSLFAFLWTFIREIIKDIEDEEGDREMESHTFPVVLGIAKTRILLYILITTTLGIGAYMVFFVVPLESSLSWRYYLCGIVIPAIILMYLIYKAKDKEDYRTSAHVAKVIMVIGTLYSLLVWYLM
jgi:4-hydroxybenzoate polyprenyltransferase